MLEADTNSVISLTCQCTLVYNVRSGDSLSKLPWTYILNFCAYISRFTVVASRYNNILHGTIQMIIQSSDVKDLRGSTGRNGIFMITLWVCIHIKLRIVVFLWP